MLILDSDITTILEGDPVQSQVIEKKILNFDPVVRIAITTIEERYRGRLAACARARTSADYRLSSAKLLLTHLALSRYVPVPFDDIAQAHFEHMRRLKLRLGTQDLRIAAIALARGAAVATRNLRDFQRVPGLTAWDPCAA